MSEWFYGREGQQYGPIDEATMKARVASGEVGRNDLVWKEGMSEWIPLSQVSELSTVNSEVDSAQESPYEVPATQPASAVSAGVPVALPTSGLAIAALVCGILSLLSCYINGLFAIPAVICGHMALKRIRPDAQPLQGGRGMAIAGLICGYIGIIIQLFFIGAIAFALNSSDFKEAMEEVERQQQIEVESYEEN